MPVSKLAKNLCQHKDIDKYLSKAKILTLACSGGNDSVALFSLLLELKANYSYEVQLAYFNHQLRSDSKAEEDFVTQLASTAKVKLYIERWQHEGNFQQVSEAAAREARYAFLKKFCQPAKENYLVLAHHQNDQAETVLLNLVRGSGLRGLTGMTVFREGIFRPLLFVKKEKLNIYLQDLGSAFYQDYTNATNEYLRNFLRNSIIPGVSEYCHHDFNEKLAFTAQGLQEVYAFLQEEVKSVFKNLHTTFPNFLGEHECLIPVASFANLHPAVGKECLAELYRHIHPYSINLKREQVEEMWTLIKEKSGKFAEVDLADSLNFIRSHQYFSIIDKRCCLRPRIDSSANGKSPGNNFCLVTEDFQIPLEKVMNCQVFIPGLEIFMIENNLAFVYNNKMWNLRLVDDQPALLRTRRVGDRILLTNGHHKLLKKRMQELQIPLKQRDRILLLTQGNNVLWPFGSEGRMHGKENCQSFD